MHPEKKLVWKFLSFFKKIKCGHYKSQFQFFKIQHRKVRIRSLIGLVDDTHDFLNRLRLVVWLNFKTPESNLMPM